MTRNNPLSESAVFGLLILAYLSAPKRSFAADDPPPPVSHATLNTCQDFAARLKGNAIESIKIVEGPFDNDSNEKIPSGCFFKTVIKPGHSGLPQKTIGAQWEQLTRYQADGPDSTSYAVQNAHSVCFISEEWSELGDDASEEEKIAWKPKPGSILVGCTDRAVFEQIDHR